MKFLRPILLFIITAISLTLKAQITNVTYTGTFTESTQGDSKVMRLTTSGTLTVTTVTGSSPTIAVLVVAGGGGGGGTDPGSATGSGGGGAGGVLYNGTVSVSSTSYAITVGVGGAGGTINGTNGLEGSSSSFSSLMIASGGGGGAATNTHTAGSGGSGGGSGYGGTQGSGVPGQGYDGGTASHTAGLWGAAGGGGANGAGVNASGGSGTDGGPGVNNSITGSSIYYGGGGGGGTYQGTGVGGLGGIGGGGDGRNYGSGGNGTPNTGGGGGGGGGNNPADYGAGGVGGSGVVIIRYQFQGSTTVVGTGQWITAANNIYNNNTGNVGIGTINPTEKLSVAGTIKAYKLTVITGWSDYVFDKNYKLPTLSETEKFIKLHQHLQGIPSAKEIEKNGLDVGNGQSLLLKKIEELTLLLIKQNKTQENFKKIIKQQNKRIEILEKK